MHRVQQQNGRIYLDQQSIIGKTSRVRVERDIDAQFRARQLALKAEQQFRMAVVHLAKALEWNVSPEEGETSDSKWEKNMAGLLRSAVPDKAHITFGVELAALDRGVPKAWGFIDLSRTSR